MVLDGKVVLLDCPSLEAAQALRKVPQMAAALLVYIGPDPPPPEDGSPAAPSACAAAQSAGCFDLVFGRPEVDTAVYEATVALSDHTKGLVRRALKEAVFSMILLYFAVIFA